MRSLKAGAAYFALVFGTGFALGAVRVPFLVPRLGERTAELIEMPLMLAAILLASRFVARKFGLPPGAAARLPPGLIALSLLLAAELSLVTFLQHQSIPDYIASRDPVSGSVYLAMLILFALMPLLLAARPRPA